MKMKRFFAAGTALAMMLTLAGCSGGTQAASESTEAAAQAAAQTVATEAAAELGEISFDISEQLQYLVDESVISQETLDAIVTYMEENDLSLMDGMSAGQMPGGSVPEGFDGTMPEGVQGGDVPEMPSGAQDGEMPEMPSGAQDGEMPEMPSGAQDGEMPEMPSGAQDGEVPEMPSGAQNGQMPSGDFSGSMKIFLSEELLTTLLENNVITQSDYDAITEYQENQRADGGSMGGAPGGSTGENISHSGATEVTSALEAAGEAYTSEKSDENALLINTSESVSITDASVTKAGDSDGGDSCNFYGINSGVLAMGGADVTISGGTVTADADGANGIFSYGGNGGQNGAAGDGTTVNVSDTAITTTGDKAGGIMTAGGGVTNASNLTIETSGRSSAAIRTDRGGGTVTVTGGSYTTNGLGSPAVYSTADITVSDAALTSNLSEGVCIEGKNSVSLTNCTLTVSNTQCNGNATFFDAVNVYQSMSGDADSGTSSFTMTGGSLVSRSGHVFHITNTHAVITLSGVEITNEDAENILLSVCDDGWSGAENRGELVCNGQVLSGKILVGSNSFLTVMLSGGSSFTGTFSGVITNSRGESVSEEIGEVSVTLDADSTWTLTEDTYISSFTGDASQIVSNGYTLYVNGAALSGTK